MCRVLFSVGSLRIVKNELRKNGIYDLHSLKEVIEFHKEFNVERERIILRHEQKLREEAKNLEVYIYEISQFIDIKLNEIKNKYNIKLEIQKNEFEEIYNSNKTWNFIKFTYKFRYRIIVLILQVEYKYKQKYLAKKYHISFQKNVDRLDYLNYHFEDALISSYSSEINYIDKKKRIIDGLQSSISGAIGEHKVVKELEKLPDNCTLINDYTVEFLKPIYRSIQKDYIKSIQIDHLLVTPAGVFVIETKNWSENSLHDKSFFSPVHQTQRAGFSIYKLISEGKKRSWLNFRQHHWGEKKIPVRNLIVFANKKPNEVFEHAKVLSIHELNGYINYFNPILSHSETQELINYLLSFRT